MNLKYCKAGTTILLFAVLNLIFVSTCVSGAELAKDAQASPVKTITLAKGGVTEYVIIEGENPSPAERTAAADLARFLNKVTGAEFKTVKEKPDVKLAKGIYVGWTGFAKGQGISVSSFAPEEWSVITVGDNIVITGGRPRGTINGAYEFLEEAIGVHELDPITEIVPSNPDLTINAPNLSGKPAFLLHDVYAPYDFAPENRDFATYFNQFNKNEGGYRPQYGTSPKLGAPGGCHTFGLYINPKEYGVSHPEYFSMNEKGERITDSKGTTSLWFDLCLSNPEVRKLLIGKLRGYIEADRKTAKSLNLPPPFIYCIDQNDCIEHGCLCPTCKTIIDREGGAESGLTVDFINAIADDIKNDYPDILIQTFAYNHTLKPPKTIKPRDNVMIRWCDNYGMSDFYRPITHEYNREMRDLLEPWSRISKNMAVWDYWRMFKRHAPGFYAPFVNISCLKPDLEYFQKNGVKSIFAQTEDFYYGAEDDYADDLQSFNPLRVWLGLKLMQDPQRDEKKLLDTFFNGYYGPAAGKMRELLSYMEKRQDGCKQKLTKLDRDEYYKAYLDLEFFVTARKMLEDAETACGTDTFHNVRVLRERIPLDSSLLHLEPSLRKTFCASGEPFPFDRSQVLSGYASAWNAYMDAFMSEKAREKAKPFVEKRIDYLRTMPMITSDSIRHNAAPVADGEIRIDGILDEAAWTKAAKMFLTPYVKMQELKIKTVVRTLWSNEKLYLSFECFDDKINDMNFQQRKQDDPDIWKDSSVEIFINPSGDRSTYYHFIVNPAGVMTDIAIKTLEGQKDYDSSWKSGAEVAVKINNDSWGVEMAIPFKAMKFEPKEKAPLIANFCRSRYLKSDDNAMQLQTWSPLLIRGFHDVEKFGTVTLTGKSNDVLFSSFEGPQDMPSFKPTGPLCVAGFVKENASDGEMSLRLELKKSDDFLGITVKVGDLSDWLGFAALKADIFVEGSETLEMGFRLAADDNAFYSSMYLKPGWNKGVSLANLIEAGKKIDLTKVKNFLFYVGKGKATSDRVIFLDNLRLVNK
jgi:hypothetical protein